MRVLFSKITWYSFSRGGVFYPARLHPKPENYVPWPLLHPQSLSEKKNIKLILILIDFLFLVHLENIVFGNFLIQFENLQ